MDSLRRSLADADVRPVQAALGILADELGGLTSWLAAQDDPVAACALFQRFGTMIRATPALRAHQRDVTEQLIAVAADILARRVGMNTDDPEPLIAATAIVGLWQVQSHSLRKHVDGGHTPADIFRAVTDDVERAGNLIDAGLLSLEPVDHPG